MNIHDYGLWLKIPCENSGNPYWMSLTKNTRFVEGIHAATVAYAGEDICYIGKAENKLETIVTAEPLKTLQRSYKETIKLNSKISIPLKKALRRWCKEMNRHPFKGQMLEAKCLLYKHIYENLL